MHHVHAKPLWAPYKMKNCARAPTARRRAVGARTETRVWRGTAGHRRASLQKPCDDLYAHCESQTTFETLPKHQNLAGHRSKLLSARSRNAKTSLGIAPNCLRRAPETPKPRWASLQIDFGALPKHQNLAWHRAPASPSLRSQQAKIAQGLKRTPLGKE